MIQLFYPTGCCSLPKFHLECFREILLPGTILGYKPLSEMVHNMLVCTFFMACGSSLLLWFPQILKPATPLLACFRMTVSEMGVLVIIVIVSVVKILLDVIFASSRFITSNL